jgi:hypothetical protein
MTNEHYLIVSYFLVGFLSLGIGVAANRMLRRPFAIIAEAVAGKDSVLLKRPLALSLALGAVLGFLSVSYRACGMSYEEIVKDRSYLVQVNRQQLQRAADWIVYAVFAWAFLVVILLGVWRRRKEESSGEQPLTGDIR